MKWIFGLTFASVVFAWSAHATDTSAAVDPGKKKEDGSVSLQGDSSKQTSPDSQLNFQKIEPITGVTFELPKGWQVLTPDQTTVMLDMMQDIIGRKPRYMKTNTTWMFLPPGDLREVYVLLSIQPLIITQKFVADMSQNDMGRFAAGYIKGAMPPLELKGYHLSPDIKASRVAIGKRLALAISSVADGRDGSTLSIRGLAVPLEKAFIMVGFYQSDATPGPWKEIMDHARATLRLADEVPLSPP